MRPPRKSGIGVPCKAAQLLEFSTLSLGHSQPGVCPPHCPRLPDAEPLGPPLSIREVAALVGVSTWTVRQTLMPRGLPHFRSGGGKLLFYKSQVIRWLIARQQKGGI
jgi:excisionase family DNA binding protein